MKRLVKDCLNTFVTVKGNAGGYVYGKYIQMNIPLRNILFDLGEKYKKQIAYVRSLPYHSEEQKEAKQELPFFYISGTFPYKNIKNIEIENASNLMCVDIDFKDNDVDLMQFRKELFNLPYVLGCYLSASGKGIYLIMCITDSKNPTSYYRYIEKLFKYKYNIIVDNQAANTARARALSYQDDIKNWTKNDNDYLDVFDLKLIEQQNEKKVEIKHTISKYKVKPGVDLIDDDDFCYAAADVAINKLGMQTNESNNMKDWLGHISTLTALGNRGLQLAKDLSRNSKGYKNDKDVETTFANYTKKTANRDYFTRYFKLCKDRLGKDWIKKVRETYKNTLF